MDEKGQERIMRRKIIAEEMKLIMRTLPVLNAMRKDIRVMSAQTKARRTTFKACLPGRHVGSKKQKKSIITGTDLILTTCSTTLVMTMYTK